MRATYDTIYFDLKRQIEGATYPYKSFLPSEAKLVKRYACAHNTVRKALSELASDGYVQPIHGKGVRVIYQSLTTDQDAFPCYSSNTIASLYEQANKSNANVHSQVLLMETVTADDALAQSSHFEKGDELVHFELVHSYDGSPLARESLYCRSDIVAGITSDDAEKSIMSYIESVVDVRLVTCKRRVTVEPANEEDLRLLEMGGATAVAIVASVAYDGNGLLCVYSRTRHHPSVFSLIQVVRHTRVSKDF